jgi:nucleotide-binding universal stress UspA family protein
MALSRFAARCDTSCMVENLSAGSQPVSRERELRTSRRPWRRILVATDGSRSSLVAAERALDLARHDAAELIVLVVRPATDDGALRVAGDGPLPRPVSELVARARVGGVFAHLPVRVGEPAEVIMAHAAGIDADVIVVGHRGWPFAEGPGRMVTGYLLRHSDRPVLVVAPWAQATANGSPSSAGPMGGDQHAEYGRRTRRRRARGRAARARLRRLGPAAVAASSVRGRRADTRSAAPIRAKLEVTVVWGHVDLSRRNAQLHAGTRTTTVWRYP